MEGQFRFCRGTKIRPPSHGKYPASFMAVLELLNSAEKIKSIDYLSGAVTQGRYYWQLYLE
jgi:hypothetical protein